MPEAPNATILDALLAALDRAADFNREDRVAPTCILWPDKHRQWQLIMPVIAERRGPVLTLGDWQPAAMQGPAIWLKTALAHRLEGAAWSADDVPIVYLPGISRADLRSADDCPPELLPLVELIFRGTTFAHSNGKDWTFLAFLLAKEPGPALDVANDAKTAEAAVRAAEVVVDMPVERLRGKRLEASDFDAMLIDDVGGQVLNWLNGPDACTQALGPNRWAAFAAAAKRDLAIDPDADGTLMATERLAGRNGGWKKVWQRFEDAPKKYRQVLALLDQAAPSDDDSGWPVYPSHNLRAEERVRTALTSLEGAAAHVAAGELIGLRTFHEPRTTSVWARLGHTPLAHAAVHLADLAETTGKSTGSGDVKALAAYFTTTGWKADLAVLRALDAVRTDADIAAVTTAIRAVYLPWLMELATRLQKHVSSVPTLQNCHDGAVILEDGECLLFADGLRYDVGQVLAESLEAGGCNVEQTTRWSAFPTVTATCKPAASPIAAEIVGGDAGAGFEPLVKATSKALVAAEFRARLNTRQIQVLSASETGDPSGQAWTEHGAVDKMGHEQGRKLAWRIDEEVAGLNQRVNALLDAGWKRVRVVTDHGWLLVPGGLPTAKLEPNMSDTKWSRCAILKDGATAPYPTAAWSWSAAVRIAVAPGATVFRAGSEYAHGGWSLQEALTPVLMVSKLTSALPTVRLSTKWTRLRCAMSVEGAPVGSRADIRRQVNKPATTLVDGGKVLDKGQAALFVADDSLSGEAAHLVVLGPTGAVLAKQTTTIGGKA